jgi:hypothetical protein
MLLAFHARQSPFLSAPHLILLSVAAVFMPSSSHLNPPNFSVGDSWISAASTALDHLHTLQVPIAADCVPRVASQPPF